MTDKELKELSEYSDEDGSETGELCWNLMGLMDSGLTAYSKTARFNVALVTELKAQLKAYRRKA